MKIFSCVIDMSVETMPLPGGGPVMLLLLNIMEKYFVDKNNSSDTHLLKHRLVEVSGRLLSNQLLPITCTYIYHFAVKYLYLNII